MSNPWFRMYAEFAHDPKVQMLSEIMQRRYVMIMCMRCSNALVTLQEEEIAFHLRITAAELAETKALFVAKGFIDECWDLLNWDKRQFSSDSSAQRVKAHRERKKAAEKKAGNVDVTLRKREANALDTDTDTDTDTEQKQVLVPVPAAALAQSEKTAEPKKPRKPTKIPLPDGFVLSDAVKTWAVARGHENLQAHFDSFVGKVRANGYCYVDWDQALQNAIRDDWAKLGQKQLPMTGAAGPPPRPSRHSGFDKIDYSEGIEDGRIT